METLHGVPVPSEPEPESQAKQNPHGDGEVPQGKVASGRVMQIVAGFSCVGKTTFLRSKRCRRLTGMGPRNRINARPFCDGEAKGRPQNRCLLHFCLGERDDDVFDRLDKCDHKKHAIVLVAPRCIHIHRLLLRLESRIAKKKPMRAEKLEKIRAMSDEDYLNAHCEALGNFERLGIPCTILCATASYSPVRDCDGDLARLLRQQTTLEVEEIARTTPRRRYGRVELPYGVRTRGLDRSPSMDAVFSRVDVRGMSVLDVGSAYGAWCFGAEEMGAAGVLGIERQVDRFHRARLYASLRGSQAIFQNGDIETSHTLQGADCILALNVLHHVADPRQVLKRLWTAARHALVIEAPEADIPALRDLLILPSVEVTILPSELPTKRGKRKILIATRREES